MSVVGLIIDLDQVEGEWVGSGFWESGFVGEGFWGFRWGESRSIT